jgi:hypothetical protein
VDRSDERVRAFDARYIAAFGEVPPSAQLRVYPYAYRGYDAVKLFGSASMQWGDDYTAKVNSMAGDLLQTVYRFEYGYDGTYRNADWPLVTYKQNYTIVVE